ncbi:MULTISPECIES: polysaccharide deacetylase family protein [unclassified Streptomyces]|jgi:peptidoglycan/xylan/chitin deacetylase (PgdA/CDA1 family)|uniref:polysaccharide deacetylase family protein n=1 Tax=unclassified Streptomyces TaxID=2593676 RepID=UPI00224F8DEA|nr:MULTISPECIES: polysaccharide deacetylase family protein [unclassified Streptomyces]MCX4401763.1 polysaccharide deacetylase family protein [Streptomyces sp. NBC_01764]MCX5183577.1 polysaccharide deacetylase family protein [Streptomyces sp. NBC_00268]
MNDTPVPILMYHSIAAAPNDATRELSVGPEAFAEQMALLGDQGFTPVDTAALAARWRSGRPLPRRPVLITFDDGYEGVHRHGLPVLAKHGFASTLFVSTGWIKGAYDTGGGLDAMLSWDQVRELAAGQVEIGGHSHTHPQLDQLTDDALRFEVLRCKEIIADELGTRPASFAYPYGYSSRRVRHVVRETGFAQSLAVGNGLARRRQGPYALQRVTVRRGTGIEEFERLVEGRAIARNFARDRALTKGYAMVRRARQVRRKAIRSRV